MHEGGRKTVLIQLHMQMLTNFAKCTNLINLIDTVQVWQMLARRKDLVRKE